MVQDDYEYQDAHPVRFYKFVALGFLLITAVLLVVIVFMSSKRATITITTTKTDYQKTSDLVIEGSDGSADSFVTSTVFSFSKNFQPTGSREEPGIAEGTVTLYNESTSAQPLVATTRLLTPEGVLFRLKEAVTVPAGGSVSAEVYADQEGASGDIGPVERFTIPGLNATKQQAIYASSDSAMSGGIKQIGILSQADVDRAKEQIVAALKEESLKVFEGLIPEGMSYVVGSVNEQVSGGGEIGTEIDGFTLTAEATVVAAVYKDEVLVTDALSEIAEGSESDLDLVTLSEAKPLVSVKEINLADQKVTLEVTHKGVASLNPESAQLDKSVFFGQSKAEVRRYLLLLDHVTGVEIELSPVWVQSVPHIYEHVTVIVKEVE